MVSAMGVSSPEGDHRGGPPPLGFAFKAVALRVAADAFLASAREEIRCAAREKECVLALDLAALHAGLGAGLVWAGQLVGRLPRAGARPNLAKQPLSGEVHEGVLGGFDAPVEPLGDSLGADDAAGVDMDLQEGEDSRQADPGLAPRRR